MIILYVILHHSDIGVVGTAKAVVSEISDDSTQSLGVSIISTSWGMGFIIGPAISGAISDPIGQYNLNITSKMKYAKEPQQCYCKSVPISGVVLYTSLCSWDHAQFPD